MSALRKRKSYRASLSLANTRTENEKCPKSKQYMNGNGQLSLTKILGFSLEEVSSWKRFVQLAFRPSDPASLGVTRALFGLMMILDVSEERGLGDADVRWGDPAECRFPLFHFMGPLPLPWMCIVYLAMWMGAFGIMLGLYFRVSCAAFLVPYWYILLLDKSSWNNHSYLFGLVAILLWGTGANHYWSVDGLLGRVKHNSHVPLWNYAILRFQFFVLYFMAGLKKLDRDWVNGYSMTYLNNHWVFQPFKLVLTSEQVDYWIVHLNGFLLDLTIGFWMFLDKTRPFAFVVCGAFHLMNSRLFSIGMFPYVCLVTMPLFCHFDWPRVLWGRPRAPPQLESSPSCIYSDTAVEPSCKPEVMKRPCESDQPSQVNWKHQLVVVLLLSHVGLQAFLPYSHFVTKGYNNWTQGLYGYSWDMMVHTWHTVLVIVRVVDGDTGQEHFLDPEAWVQTDKWEKHGDMMYQYAHCLKHNLIEERKKNDSEINSYLTSDNFSIHFDVWSSLNRRFQQRMFDPRADLLSVAWSPWERVSWLMPLLTELSSWRQRISDLEKQVYSWSNHSDTLFIADFPGLFLENYIAEDLKNVTLTVLEGEIVVEFEGKFPKRTLKEGQAVPIHSGAFHRVHTSSATPSCYMYSYVNATHQLISEEAETTANPQPQLPVATAAFKTLLNEIRYRCDNLLRAIALVSNAVLNILYDVPMLRRVRVG